MKDLVRRVRRYPEYKDSGVDWLGEIPSHWVIKRLKTTTNGCQNGLWGGEPDGINDIVCIRVADFDREGLRVDPSKSTLRSIDERSRQGRLLKAGDLLLEKSGGGEKQPVGCVVLYEYTEPAICSNFIARMPPVKGVCSRYLTYLHGVAYSARINTKSIKQNTGIQNLDSKAYLNELAPIPPTDEQYTIAAFLDRETTRVDALVAKKERLIELLQEKRTALITQAVTKGLVPNVPMKDSEVEWLGEVPTHWNVLCLRRVIRSFVDYRGKTPEKTPTGVRLVTARNIKNQTVDFSLSEEFIPEDLYGPWMVRGFPERGDVLITTEAPLGETAQIDDPTVALAQRIILLKPDRLNITGDFLKYHFVGDLGHSELWSHATGSTALGIKASHLKATLVAVPPLEEQETITALADNETAKIDRMILKIHQGVDQLQEYRTALISSAVTGKIDVRQEVT